LSREEAQARIAKCGRNELTAEKPVPAWRRFLAQFQDVLVILLIIAALISAGLWLLERDSALPYEALAILAVVLLNALMGFIQQSRAEQAVAALRRMCSVRQVHRAARSEKRSPVLGRAPAGRSRSIRRRRPPSSSGPRSATALPGGSAGAESNRTLA
jgi:Ca2+-transporting ATPase